MLIKSFLILCVLFLCSVTANSDAGKKPLRKVEISPNTRIFGGSFARPGQIPYIVALLFNVQTENGTVAALGCAGSLISEQWVVSAAHCSSSNNITRFRVLVGATNLIADGEEYDVQRIVNHPNFNINATHIEEDISLIQLAVAVEWSERVNLISLKTPYIDSGVRTLTSGWGLTEHGKISYDLRYVHVYTLDNEECRSIAGNFSHLVTDTMICARLTSGSGTCNGDSGGPLVAGGRLIGIVSWGIRPCGAGNPDGYTRISPFLDWIANVTGVVAV